MQDKVLDVAVTLEGMYELPRRGKSYELQKRVANFLGTDRVRSGTDQRDHPEVVQSPFRNCS